MKNLSAILEAHRSKAAPHPSARPSTSAPDGVHRSTPLLPTAAATGASSGGGAPLGARVRETLDSMPPHLAQNVDSACESGFGALSAAGDPGH